MNKNKLTHTEAWEDFKQWLHAPEQNELWRSINRRDKQYIGKADLDARRGRLGYERVKNILRKYAPNRYEFMAFVIAQS